MKTHEEKVAALHERIRRNQYKIQYHNKIIEGLVDKLNALEKSDSVYSNGKLYTYEN